MESHNHQCHEDTWQIERTYLTCVTRITKRKKRVKVESLAELTKIRKLWRNIIDKTWQLERERTYLTSLSKWMNGQVS